MGLILLKITFSLSPDFILPEFICLNCRTTRKINLNKIQFLNNLANLANR
jgi:hypothetical protein